LTSIGFVAVIASLASLAQAQTVDNLEGVVVREIRVTGVKTMPAGFVERHLRTQVGQPFHWSSLQVDRRRLDELRLFTSVSLKPRLDSGAVILEVAVEETLRVLPIVVLRVTDENGLSAGPGLKGLNLFGKRAQVGASVRFGGETAATLTIDTTTITPGTRAWHFGFSDTSRQNTLYGFEEHATSADVRMSKNWRGGLRGGFFSEFMTLDTGASGASLSPDGRDNIPTVGVFCRPRSARFIHRSARGYLGGVPGRSTVRRRQFLDDHDGWPTIPAVGRPTRPGIVRPHELSDGRGRHRASRIHAVRTTVAATPCAAGIWVRDADGTSSSAAPSTPSWCGPSVPFRWRASICTPGFRRPRSRISVLRGTTPAISRSSSPSTGMAS
jgi:hypothetical protein